MQQQSIPATTASSPQSAPVVETTNGKIRGTVQQGAYVFKGVRYGQSTAGLNRFMPPLPPKKWTGVQDALTWGASAPQLVTALTADPFFPGTPRSRMSMKIVFS